MRAKTIVLISLVVVAGSASSARWLDVAEPDPLTPTPSNASASECFKASCLAEGSPCIRKGSVCIPPLVCVEGICSASRGLSEHAQTLVWLSLTKSPQARVALLLVIATVAISSYTTGLAPTDSAPRSRSRAAAVLLMVIATRGSAASISTAPSLESASMRLATDRSPAGSLSAAIKTAVPIWPHLARLAAHPSVATSETRASMPSA